MDFSSVYFCKLLEFMLYYIDSVLLPMFRELTIQRNVCGAAKADNTVKRLWGGESRVTG